MSGGGVGDGRHIGKTRRMVGGMLVVGVMGGVKQLDAAVALVVVVALRGHRDLWLSGRVHNRLNRLNHRGQLSSDAILWRRLIRKGQPHNVQLRCDRHFCFNVVACLDILAEAKRKR